MTLTEALRKYPNTYRVHVAAMDAKFGPFSSQEAATSFGEQLVVLNPGMTYEVEVAGFIAPHSAIG